jgi:hypothetical protein
MKYLSAYLQEFLKEGGTSQTMSVFKFKINKTVLYPEILL